MRISLLLVSLTMAAATTFAGVTQSQAGFPAPPGLPPAPPLPLPGLSLHLNGYIPPPPGVHVYAEGERPYYIKGRRRVYLERDSHYRKHRGFGHGHGHGKHGHGH